MSKTLKTLVAVSLVAFVAACAQQEEVVIEPVMEEPVMEKM